MAFVNQGWHVGSETRADPVTVGGTESTYGSFKIHTFLTSGTFTYSGASSDITGNILSVAGGGGGAGNQGGGGAGGMLTQDLSIAPGVYNIVVGAGGSQTTAGFNSQTNITGETVSIGGGYNNGAGGSGAGGGQSGEGGGAGTAGQGNNGGSGANC